MSEKPVNEYVLSECWAGGWAEWVVNQLNSQRSTGLDWYWFSIIHKYQQKKMLTHNLNEMLMASDCNLLDSKSWLINHIVSCAQINLCRNDAQIRWTQNANCCFLVNTCKVRPKRVNHQNMSPQRVKLDWLSWFHKLVTRDPQQHIQSESEAMLPKIGHPVV